MKQKNENNETKQWNKKVKKWKEENNETKKWNKINKQKWINSPQWISNSHSLRMTRCVENGVGSGITGKHFTGRMKMKRERNEAKVSEVKWKRNEDEMKMLWKWKWNENVM